MSKEYPIQDIVPEARPNWKPPYGYFAEFPDSALVWAAGVEECITDIYVNPVAQDILPQDFRYLTNDDFLLNHALMTAPPSQSRAIFATPQNWTRSIISTTVDVPYNNQVGRYVMCKGNSASGKSYGLVNFAKESTDPHGFFGAKDAQKELFIGNKLLQAGFRASLPLGYLVLDQKMLKRTLEQLWREHTSVNINIQDHLNQVETNQDLPAILVRLTGCKKRLAEGIMSSNIEDALSGLELIQGVEPTGVQALRDRKPVTKDLLANIQESFARVIESNQRALEKVSSLTGLYQNIAYVLTTSKDLDSTLSIQDFEESSHIYHVDRPYKERMASTLNTYFHSLLTYLYPGAQPTNILEGFEEGLTRI